MSASLIAGFILLVLSGFARVVFGVHIRGSFAGFVGVCAAFSLMTAAFGLLIVALVETVEATRGYSIMATLIMVMLGDAWEATFIFPKWLQEQWAMDGLAGMTWRGFDLSQLETSRFSAKATTRTQLHPDRNGPSRCLVQASEAPTSFAIVDS